jgi:hypothetical protein
LEHLGEDGRSWTWLGPTSDLTKSSQEYLKS